MSKKDNNIPENMPLTTIVRHTIKKGAEKDFEQWSRDIESKVSKFKGFKGNYVVPPKKGDITNEYIVVFQFDNINNLLLWMNSKERTEALKNVKTFSGKEMQIQREEGLGFLFTSSNNGTQKPPKWKIAVITWIAVFPMVITLLHVYSGLFPMMSLTFKVLLVTITLVILLTWVLMPNLTKLFHKWLF